MRKIDQLLEEYGASHQNSTNKLIHWICVPLIFWSIIGMVWSIPHGILNSAFPNSDSPFLNWASICAVVVLLYYFTLSFRLFLGMAILVTGFLQVSLFVERLDLLPVWQIALAVFVVAWIFQFYGHEIEGKKPSFLKDVQFLLIGPAWLMSFVFKSLGFGY